MRGWPPLRQRGILSYNNSRLLFIKKLLIKFPTSSSLSFFHNFGSALGLFYFNQLVTGLILVFYYENSFGTAYFSVNQIVMIETNHGWLIRLLHFNGARWIFFLAYLHLRKALYFLRWRLTQTWLRGVLLLLLLMGVAFLGYSLLLSQMRYWAGVVIRGLLGVLRTKLVWFLWGSFTFRENALKLFFELHFILPLVLGGLILYHLTRLHTYRRTNLLGLPQRVEAQSFYPLFWVKDLINLSLYLLFLASALWKPWVLGEPLIFEERNGMVSPRHIVPEWYFCVSYAILRSVPNKLAGVAGLLLRVTGLRLLSLGSNGLRPLQFLNKILTTLFIRVALLLGWLGRAPAVSPYREAGWWLSLFYFLSLRRLWIASYLTRWLYKPFG